MAMRRTRDLSRGFTTEVDQVDEQTWYQFLREFEDASIFQTWAWGAVTSGRRNLSHLVVRKDGSVVAVAQAKIMKIPFVKVGVAYVRWGPLWRLRGTEPDVEAFRQVLRALRNEYVCRRRLVLRLFPSFFDDNALHLSEILEEEGFASPRNKVQNRTILMDVEPSLNALRAGMSSHSRRQLRTAEKAGLEVLEGSGDELFASFLNIYKEMISRKRFVPGADADQFRLIQSRLPEDLKMKIKLCRSEEGVCAGLICSAIGRSAIYLFGATSNAGQKWRGSYLLQWKFIEDLKQLGVSVYNLYGIDPKKNPGTYRFKNELSGKNGKEVSYLGRFDSYVGFLDHSCLEIGEKLKSNIRTLRGFIKGIPSTKAWSKAAH